MQLAHRHLHSCCGVGQRNKPADHIIASMLELRIGGTGAGAFVGCGAGLGFITPISLHSIPVLGQLASGLSSSIASVDAALGGLGSAARHRTRGLGVRGLDCGFGCGVMVGYGYGAGLMLNPRTAQSLKAAAERLREQLLLRLPSELRGSLERAPASAGPLQSAQQVSVDMMPPSNSWAPVPAPGPPSVPPSMQLQQHEGTVGGELADLMRLVLKQQNLLEDLQQQVQTLQAAVCRLDGSAPGCNTNR